MKAIGWGLLVLCAACGGSGATTEVVAFGATSFHGVDALAHPSLWWGTASADGTGWSGCAAAVDVVVSPIECGGARSGPMASIDVANGEMTPLGPGTYQVGAESPTAEHPTPVATVVVFPDVDFVRQLRATSGRVTFAQITAGGITGSLDVTLEDGTALRGPFDAPSCQQPEAEQGQQVASGCAR